MTQQAAAAVDGILNGVKKHGLSVTLLIAAVYWMNAKNETLSTKVDSLNTQIIEIYEKQNNGLSEIVKSNTKAFENFSFYLMKEENKQK